MERAGYEAVHWLARPSFQQILVVADETGTCISVCLMCFDHDEMPDLMGMVPVTRCLHECTTQLFNFMHISDMPGDI
jgi:hypothetical protein